MRKIGCFFIISSILAVVAELFYLKLPTISWAFNMAYDNANLRTSNNVDGWTFAWFGYLVAIVAIGLGIFMLRAFPVGALVLPTTQRRIQRFKESKRGYYSLIVIMFVVLLASFDQLLVGKKAIYVSYDDKTFCPALMRQAVMGADIGLKGDDALKEVEYRSLKKLIEKEGEGLCVMPLIPYDPTEDTAKVPFVELEMKDGKLLGPDGQQMRGRVSVLYNGDSETRHMVYEYRDGVKQGRATGKDLLGNQVYEADYKNGVLIKETYIGAETSKEDFLPTSDLVYTRVFNHSAPPMGSHLLGTTPVGNDLVAYLYGGLQVNIRAVLIYIPMIYMVGVSIGLVMGYFGGWFDLIVQRLIEIFSTIPFLFVVIIFSSLVDSQNRGLIMILVILVSFGWMGMTYLMRTAAMKEKARDYVAAASVSGASTPRILFSHILPNTVAILVTLVPFSVSAIIIALTSLDYLGFGLPPQYATWGTLLKDGLENFSKPWLVTSAFATLVTTLILTTFVGEAVRDAFDPKKFSTYK